MRRAALLLFLVLPFPSAGIGADHSPLLPRPQEIRYGPGHLRVRGLTVHLPAVAGAEERFAAQEIANFLSERAGVLVAVSEAAAAGVQIVLKRTGPVDALPLPDEQPSPESREAYSIKVTPQGVEILARSSAGVFYGVQTMRQLVEGSGDEAALPEVEIRDWPSVAYRGTMVDMSHGPLPTEEEVERQIDFLARWKANQYYFYSEASLELDGYTLLNPDGRFTKQQVRRIIAYGRERHIDVVPLVELYGHLHDVFRVERYSDLAPISHGGEFNPGNPRVKVLLADWVDQISRLFPSPFVHIGFDETWEIEKAAQRGGAGATPAKLYIQQLNDVTRLFEQHGKRVMAWGDIMVKYPQIVSELPPRLIAVAWEYDAEPDKDYMQRLGPLAARRVPHFVQPGITSWNDIAPDFPRTFENVDTFLAAGRRSGALGLINSLWTDDAQILIRMSWPGMAYGAVAPWQSEPMNAAGFFSDYARIMYSAAAAPEVAAALSKLAGAEVHLQKFLGEGTMLALWDNPFEHPYAQKVLEQEGELRQARLMAEDAQEHLLGALYLGGDPATLESLLLGSRLVDYAGQKFLAAKEMTGLWIAMGPHPTGDQFWREWESEVVYQSHGRLSDLMDAITELRELYRSEWLAEYTPYRLRSALGRWDAEYEFWRRLQARFRAFAKNYHQGDTLPPLESFTKAD